MTDNSREYDFGNDFISLGDDEGNEFEFEVLDAIEDDNGRYVALLPVFDEAQASVENDGQLIIMKVVEEDGEEFFEEIEDEEEFQRISDEFIERLGEDYEIEE
ncbi:MAG: DUF1292 domain-containing protein [Clostridia bacterium]|nr:DUF1292 domain-containing protein [Clostridia bacterium]